jgi:secreted PhoX family phosphatase
MRSSSPLASRRRAVVSARIFRKVPGSSGDARPETVITKGMGNGPTDMAVDLSGDLWVVNQFSNAVVEYSRAELALASPAPTVTIHVAGPDGVAFDPSGDLWVTINRATASNGAVEEFTQAELAKSGSPVPVFTLGEADCRTGIDSSGDL